MTEVSQLDIDTSGAPSRASADQESLNHGRDWLLMLLVAGVILALVAALAVGLLLLLDIFTPDFNLQLVKLSSLPTSLPIPPTIGDNLNLQQVVFLLLAGLLFLAFVFYLLARWRVLRKRFLWPAAGCPSCGHEILVRVHRQRKDRLYAWIGIPVGRYHCRECRWRGLRIQRGMLVAGKSVQWEEALTAALNSKPTARGARLRRGLDLGKMVATTTAYGTSNVQRMAKSSDPAGVNAAATDEAALEAAPAVQESGAAAEKTTTGSEEPTVDVAAAMLAEGHAVPDVAESQPAEEERTPASEESWAAESAAEEPAPNGISPAPVAGSRPDDEPAQDTELARERGMGSAATWGEITAPFGLNLREDPQSDGALLGMLNPGTSVMLLDQVIQNDGTAWQYVKVNDQHGWVLSAFIKVCE